VKAKAVIDRIESGYAVLLLDEKHTVDFPLEFLPEGISESDVLSIEIHIDKKEREKRKRKISKLIRKLQEKEP
jgi:hypothetical protein